MLKLFLFIARAPLFINHRMSKIFHHFCIIKRELFEIKKCIKLKRANSPCVNNAFFNNKICNLFENFVKIDRDNFF